MSAIQLLGLDHVVLRVRNVERALAFYCGVLGCSEERRSDALGLVQLRAGAHLIDLVDVAAPLGKAGGAAAGPEARNVDHFALQLAHFDAQAIRAELLAAGIEAGDVVERYGARGMGPSLYVKDPDDNVVELKGVPSDRNPLATRRSLSRARDSRSAPRWSLRRHART